MLRRLLKQLTPVPGTDDTPSLPAKQNFVDSLFGVAMINCQSNYVLK